MSTTEVTFYTSVTEIAENRAIVDHWVYLEWCDSNDLDPTDTWNLRDFVLAGSYDYVRSCEVISTEFRDFEDEGYIDEITAPVEPISDAEARRHALDLVDRRGRVGLVPPAYVIACYGVTADDAERIIAMREKVNITLEGAA